MVQNISFRISVYIDNPGMLPELQYRTDHLEPAFDAIFNEWVALNAQKFEQSVGAELSGAEVFDEEWAPVTLAYYRSKHAGGTTRVTKTMARGGKARFEEDFPDWLLVRSGALREAMTNPDALFSNIGDEQAIFGMPNDTDLADIVEWQARPRQKERFVVFLSDPDMNAIRRILQDYFSMGGDFADIRADKALAAVNAKTEIDAMDAEFNVAMNPDQAQW